MYIYICICICVYILYVCIYVYIITSEKNLKKDMIRVAKMFQNMKIRLRKPSLKNKKLSTIILL